MRLIENGNSKKWGFELIGGNENNKHNRLTLCGFGRYRRYELEKEWLKSKEINITGYKYPVLTIPILEMVLSLDKPYTFRMGYSKETYTGELVDKNNYRCFCFLSWMERRKIKTEILDWDSLKPVKVQMGSGVIRDIPDEYKRVFKVKDVKNNMELIATCHIEKDTWARGIGLFKWLSYFFKNIEEVYVEVNYSTDIGEGRNSWKGGIIGHYVKVENDDVMGSLINGLKEKGVELL